MAEIAKEEEDQINALTTAVDNYNPQVQTCRLCKKEVPVWVDCMFSRPIYYITENQAPSITFALYLFLHCPDIQLMTKYNPQIGPDFDVLVPSSPVQGASELHREVHRRHRGTILSDMQISLQHSLRTQVLQGGPQVHSVFVDF